MEHELGQAGLDVRRHRNRIRVLLLQGIARAEGKQGQPTRPQTVLDANLIVPVVQAVLAGKRRKQHPGVGIATSHRNCPAPFVKGRGHNPARVEKPYVSGDMQAIGGGRSGARGNDTRDVAAVFHRIAARVELHLIEKEGVDDRRPECEMEQRWRPHAVNKEASVAGIGAANGVHGHGPDRLHHARQGFDHTEGVAERARGVGQFLALHGNRGRALGRGHHHGFVAVADQARL